MLSGVFTLSNPFVFQVFEWHGLTIAELRVQANQVYGSDMTYDKEQFSKPTMNAYERRKHNSRAMAAVVKGHHEERPEDYSFEKKKPSWTPVDQKREDELWDE